MSTIICNLFIEQLKEEGLNIVNDYCSCGHPIRNHNHRPILNSVAIKKRKVDDLLNDSSIKELHKATGIMALSTIRTCYHMQSILESMKTEQVQIFIRNEVLRFYEFVNNYSLVIVTGSPGIGKSTSSWMWLCDQLEIILNLILFGEDFDDSIDIIVYDGVTNITFNEIWKDARSKMTTRHDNLTCKVLIITSTQVRYKSNILESASGANFEFQPWSFNEYHQACNLCSYFSDHIVNDKDITASRFENDNIRSLIDKKIYYAGYSARWMFQYTVEKVEKEIKEKIREINNCDLLIKGLSGDRSNIAVNHLFTSFVKYDSESYDYCILVVSEYASRLLVEKCSISFIEQATLLSRQLNNPAFDGWILEMDALFHIKKNQLNSRLKFVTIDNNNNNQNHIVSDDFDFSFECSSVHRYDDLKSLKTTTQNSINTWFIPNKFNQGGFDAVQLLSNNTLRFIQITRAINHGLKLHLMNIFIKIYNQHQTDIDSKITNLEIVMIYPKELEKSFEQPTHANIIGSVQEFGWDITQLKFAIYCRADYNFNI